MLRLVETSASAEVLGDAFEVALYSGGGFALAYRGRFFVMLTTTRLGEHTRFFAGTLETTQSEIEWLVVLYFN